MDVVMRECGDLLCSQALLLPVPPEELVAALEALQLCKAPSAMAGLKLRQEDHPMACLECC